MESIFLFLFKIEIIDILIILSKRQFSNINIIKML